MIPVLTGSVIGYFVCRRIWGEIGALRLSQEPCEFVPVSRTKVASTRRKPIQRETLSRLSLDIQPLSLLGVIGTWRAILGVSSAECRFAQGHPLHLELLAIRCSDVWTIAHVSSSAEGFLIGPVRLLEFFDGCGGANQRQCGQNVCLQNYKIDAPRAVCSSLSDCFHVPFLTLSRKLATHWRLQPEVRGMNKA